MYAKGAMFLPICHAVRVHALPDERAQHPGGRRFSVGAVPEHDLVWAKSTRGRKRGDMQTFIMRRLMIGMVIIVFLSVAVFVLLHIVPGDPTSLRCGLSCQPAAEGGDPPRPRPR